MLLVAGVAFLLAIVFLTNAVYFYRKDRRERAAWASAGGVVVELHERAPSAREATVFNPIVRYTTSKGAVVRFEDRVGHRPPRHAVGQAVRVLYDPADPQSARIDTGSAWGIAAPALAFGLGSLALAAALVWFRFHPLD